MSSSAASPVTHPPLRAAAPAVTRDLFWLSLLCLVLFGLGLGSAPLANPDEARYGEIPREMLASGDFVTPRLDGVLYFEKPPLTYWLVAGSLATFGPSETAARATPALVGLLGVLLTYATGRALAGRAAGWWSAVVLATSLLYFAHARILLTDMVVSVLISATLCCFLLGVREPPGRRRAWLFHGLYAAAALATLAKGLIGFLLPGAVMFLWLLLFDQWRRLRPFFLPSGLLLFAAIAVPWHVMVAQRNPNWAWFYFVHEHWMRFTTTTHGRNQPWWFFLPVVVLGLFPWTGFLWSAVRTAAPAAWARRREAAEAGFLLLWAGFIFLFFSASKSKLIPYVLPVFPPLALLIGQYLASRLETDYSRRLVAGLLGSVAVAGVLSIALLTVGLNPQLLGKVAHAETLGRFALVAGNVLVACALATGALVICQRTRLAAIVLSGGTAAFMLVLIFAAPVIARPSTRELAVFVAQHASPDDIVVHYHDYFHDFSYYAARTAGTIGFNGELELALDPEAARRGPHVSDEAFPELWAGPRRVYLLLRRSELPQLARQPGFQLHIAAETPAHLLLTNRP